MKFMLLALGACAAVASAAPSLEARASTGAFSCQIDQESRCCVTVAFPGVSTGCQAAMGGIGYAKCPGTDKPACCFAQSALGNSACAPPTNTNLPNPPAGSGIGGVAKGSFSCFQGARPVCCDTVTLSGSATGPAPAQACSGCVDAPGSATLAKCAKSTQFGLCSGTALALGASASCQFSGLLPRGK